MMDKATIENYFRGDAVRFYREFLPDLKPGTRDELKALCPFHEDHDPSMSINSQTGLFNCFGCNAAGSIFDFWARKHGLDARRDLPTIIGQIAQQFGIRNGKRQHVTGKQQVVARYDYQDEVGAVLYQIERLEPKLFRIRRPDGQRWIYNAVGIKIVPYHLPEIRKATEVIICEGEKDADALAALGFTATTNPFGAGKWPQHFSSYFAGKRIVLIPDNDEPGREHMKQVAANLPGHAASIKWLELPDLPDKGDVSDFIVKYQDKEEAAERLALLIEGAKELIVEDTETIQIVNASVLLSEIPAEPDQILEDTFDVGDKIAIIGSSKLRKSFFLLMLLLCLAAGRDFLSWRVVKPRRVFHVQLEIQPNHYHRRVRRMAQALGIGPEDLGDRLQILNARGLGLTGADGVKRIRELVTEFHPEIISFDPLYKIASGVENAAEDFKIVLNSFDELAEVSGAAIAYVHHDSKGTAGDRDIRDRGAGSGVLGRDYDACITLTPHAQEEDAIVVETLLRNYRPQDAFTIVWQEDMETGGYRFEQRPDIMAEKKTSRTRPQLPSLATYFPAAESILKKKEMEVASFKVSFKEMTGLSDHRIRDFLAWATAGGNPYITTREIRGDKLHKKWLKLERRPGNEG